MDIVTRPRVLMIGPSLGALGGMTTVEQNILDAIDCGENKVVFIPTYNEGNKAKKLVIAAAAYARYVSALKQCDLVHVHMASRGSYARKKVFMESAFKRGVPVVLHLHSGEFSMWFGKECDDAQRDDIRRTFHKCAAVIVLSEEWRDCLLSQSVCEASKLHVLHNAVPVPARPCSPCSRQDVLFLGRLDANKSPDVLLRASSGILEQYPNAKLIFGGDGYPEHYEALAQELGIADRCEFLGWVSGDAKEELFARAGVYCLPSKNEGMPMSVLEAMAHGIPTIATPVGGVPQVITDGENGFLMPVDNENALSEILCELMASPELRESIGAAGRKTIQSDFSIDRNVDELVEIYRELVS